MKKLFLAMLAAAMLSCSAYGGEMEEYTFLDGIYTFGVPEGWNVDADEKDHIGLAIMPTEGMESHILMLAPNPHIEGELKEYAETYLASKFNMMDFEWEIDETSEESFHGNPGFMVTYDVMIGTEEGSGFVIVFEIDGYAILLDAQGPDSDSEFLENLHAVFESLDVDSDMFEDYEDELDEIGRKILQELAKGLEK